MVLASVDESWATSYIDDIILFASTNEQALERLKIILNLFKKAKITFSVEKCSFLVNKTTFLGFLLTSEGLKTDPEKLKAMVELERPNSVKMV